MGKKRVIQATEEELLKEKDKLDQKLKKETSVKVSNFGGRARICVVSSYNNTIISLTNERGDVLFSRAAGALGFKGTKKGTSFAASKVAESVVGACEKMRIKAVDVLVKGVGPGRDTALKSLANQGLELQSIRDITGVPHNGCRPKKPRRV